MHNSNRITSLSLIVDVAQEDEVEDWECQTGHFAGLNVQLIRLVSTQLDCSKVVAYENEHKTRLIISGCTFRELNDVDGRFISSVAVVVSSCS